MKKLLFVLLFLIIIIPDTINAQKDFLKVADLILSSFRNAGITSRGKNVLQKLRSKRLKKFMMVLTLAMAFHIPVFLSAEKVNPEAGQAG